MMPKTKNNQEGATHISFRGMGNKYQNNYLKEPEVCNLSPERRRKERRREYAVHLNRPYRNI